MPSTFIAIDFINNAVDERLNAKEDVLYVRSLSELDKYITNGSCYRVRLDSNGQYKWYNLIISKTIADNAHVPLQVLSNNEGYMVRSQNAEGEWGTWSVVANVYPIKAYTTIGNNKDGGRKYLTLECPKDYIRPTDSVVFVRYVRSTNKRNIVGISEKTYHSRKKSWKEIHKPQIELSIQQIINFNYPYGEDRWRVIPTNVDIPLAEYLLGFHKEGGTTGKDNNLYILGKQLGIYISRDGMRISDYIPFRVCYVGGNADNGVTLSV